MNPTGPYQIFLLTLIALAAYLIPAAVALSRGHRQTTPIVVLNIVFGWTGLGWIAALVWGLSGPALPTLPAADASSTRRDRIAGFTRESSWQPVPRQATPGPPEGPAGAPPEKTGALDGRERHGHRVRAVG